MKVAFRRSGRRGNEHSPQVNLHAVKLEKVKKTKKISLWQELQVLTYPKTKEVL